MNGIGKSFPGVLALQDVDLTLQKGQVLALVGENGAGKSTLIKVLGGAHLPDIGSIVINGINKQIHSPASAQNAGVSIIYQEFNLVPDLTVQVTDRPGTDFDAPQGFGDILNATDGNTGQIHLH